MPQHPAPRPSRPDFPPGPYPNPPVPSPHPPIPPERVAEGPSADTAVVVSPPAKDLTVNKILAGAGAAATTAVLGSYFGAAGTVAGAALGSVASTLATTIYQRSLDRTSETLVARIRPVGGRGASGATAPMPRLPSDEATVQLRLEPAVPPARPRRRWVAWVGATVLVFLLGLLAVTGIEWLKGSAITSGDPGTSVGRVLGADPGTTAPTEDRSPTSESRESTPDPTSSADPSATPSSTAEPDAGSSGSGTESTSPPTTANAPGLGGLLPGQSGGQG